MTLTEPAPDGTPDPRPGTTLGRSRLAAGWVLALAGVPLLTAGLVPFREGPAPTLEAMLYLALAVACALVGGRTPALVASLLGTLCMNYFFTAPLHTLVIANVENVVTLALFVIVSVAVSSVVDSAARRRVEALSARNEANTLAMLNRKVLGGEYDVPQLLELVRDTFGARAAELLPADRAGDLGEGDSVAPDNRSRLLVLRGRSTSPQEQRILAAFATHLGVLEERAELARQTAAARALEAGNRTRTALLAAVSHDLRTPLAGIKAASGTLRLADAAPGSAVLSDQDRADLLSTIEESADSLTAIVADLLDMTRLQTGAVEPTLRAAPLAAVVESALGGVADGNTVQVASRLPAALVDASLLERVVANLATNALRHADRVEIVGESRRGRTLLKVVDHGPGVSDAEKELMFEPFHRLGDTRRGSGVGLGLTVARGLTEAQGGLLTMQDTPGGGLTAVVDLPGVPDAAAGR